MGFPLIEAVRGAVVKRLPWRQKVPLPTWHPSRFALRVFAVEVTSRDLSFHMVARKMFPMNWGSASYFKVAVPGDGSMSEHESVCMLREHFAESGQEFNLRPIDCTCGPRLSDGALEDITPMFLVKPGEIVSLEYGQVRKLSVYTWELVSAQA